MNIPRFLKRLEKLTIDNSPAILTAVGVTGTLTTAYLTGKASIQAFELLQDEQDRIDIANGPHLEPREMVELTWRLYIPAASSAALTVAAIIAANRVGTRRAAAVATAYSLSEKAFGEYKEKVVEKMGEKKERDLRDELAQDRVTRDDVNDRTVIITDNGEVLCYDQFTGRYFKSNVESIKQAENEINRQIITDGYASVSDLFDLLGLPPTSFSEEVGWNVDSMLKIQFSTVMSTDNRPCIAIDFDLHPSRGYSHFAGESW